MQWAKFYHCFAFIVILCTTFNITNTSEVSLENALVYGHYITLVPNSLILIYTYAISQKLHSVKEYMIVRIGFTAYEKVCFYSVFMIMILYLIVLYMLNGILYTYQGGIDIPLMYVCMFGHTIQLFVGGLLLASMNQKVYALMCALGLNYGFHYILIPCLFGG